jgi:hypothetical protein
MQGGAAPNCEMDYPECCAALDNLPCRGLSESACGAHEYCKPVFGTHFSPAAGGTGGAPERTYLGCFSFCAGIGDLEACTYDPSAPTNCYLVPDQAVPDGWPRLSCSSAPLDQCDL